MLRILPAAGGRLLSAHGPGPICHQRESAVGHTDRKYGTVCEAGGRHRQERGPTE